MNDQAQRILAAIRARGCEAHGGESDAGEFRHAVHEAVHGLRLKVPTWKNAAIHRACTKVRPGDRLVEELIARAVEQLVCQRLGVEIMSVEKYAFITCMESLKHRLDIGPIDFVAEGIRSRMTDTRVVAPLVEQILALGAVESTTQGETR